ncbi:MAG: sigma-70 family RNA polymerase sigma factor [Anaerolineaceae bacterium]|nr:sigma-70 family RNA polymerase sigma factor [Anaerolineaceae bacterium]
MKTRNSWFCQQTDIRGSYNEELLGQKIVKARKLLKSEIELTEQEKIIVAEGEDSVNILVESHLKLSRDLAGIFASKYPKLLLDEEDLEQEGNLGLIHAAWKFDPEKCDKFAPYAIHWIKHYIRRAIEDKGDMIRKPASVHNKMRKIHKFSTDTSAEEVSQRTNIKEKEVVFIRDLDKSAMLSLDEPIYDSFDENEDNMYEKISDSTDVSGDVEYKNLKHQAVIALLKIKDETTRNIMLMYFGYTKSHQAYTCPQIAEMTGLTRYKVKKTVDETVKLLQRRFRRI